MIFLPSVFFIFFLIKQETLIRKHNIKLKAHQLPIIFENDFFLFPNISSKKSNSTAMFPKRPIFNGISKMNF
jgi:hypothetical protein